MFPCPHMPQRGTRAGKRGGRNRAKHPCLHVNPFKFAFR